MNFLIFNQVALVRPHLAILMKGQQVSVVYFDPDSGEIDWPENPAAGVLVVPKPLSIDEWEKKAMENRKINM